MEERGIAILGPHPNFLNRNVVTMVKPYKPPAAEKRSLYDCRH